MEKWVDVVGYEGDYEVSDLGNVRNKKTKKVLKQRMDMYGYLKVTLSKNNKPKTFLVHRLVATAFIPNPLDKPQVNHKDTDKTNNCVSNLEWSTHKENISHAVNNGLGKYKFLSQTDIDEIRLLYKHKINPRKIAESFGVSFTTVMNVIRREGRYKNM